MDIRDPSHTDVGRWVRSLGERGLSPKTIRNHHGVAYSMLQAAVEHEPVPMRAGNPCSRTRLPEVVQEEMRFLTHQEFDRLLKAAPEFYRPVFVTLVGTGLRWGELAGLHVKNVDLLANPPVLRVTQTLQRQTDGGSTRSDHPRRARRDAGYRCRRTSRMRCCRSSPARKATSSSSPPGPALPCGTRTS